MSYSEKALSAFRQKPLTLNCAQAVCYGAGREDLLEKMAQCGGGKAPDGLCGALYGAMTCAGAELAPRILAKFTVLCGHRTCKELKQACKVPCTQCVKTASDVLEAM